MKYRPEIDGLRAIAVVSVILFHAGVKCFSGGFVGVDIFFVISGYLITTIILSEMEQGTFSLVNFYERRAKRIIPALFLVMFLSLPFAWLRMLPSDMKNFSDSLMAVSVFSSNILFFSETGYWGAINEIKPLLHTWSLAAEEQYYIVFPLFLMLIWRFAKKWIFVSFIIITAISLGLSQWRAYSNPSANFFLLPTRGWEIAIGAIVAFYVLYNKQKKYVFMLNKVCADNLFCFVGISMIGYAIFSFDDMLPFPSFYALLPTVGTALIIIFSSPQTLVGRLLATKPMVSIGLISYSIYLWHQPLFAFARHKNITPPSEQLFVFLAVLSLPLAYFSWNYVEKPFKRVSRKTIFAFTAIGSAIFMTIGLSGHMTNGFEGRATGNGLTLYDIEKKMKPNYGLNDVCGNGSGESILSPYCRTNNHPEILIFGDSYAMHLTQLIIASKPDAKIIQMTRSRCGPFFNIAPVSVNHPVRPAQNCLKFSRDVYDWIKSNSSVRYVVISSRFGQYLANGNKLLFRSGKIITTTAELVEQELKATLNELKSLGTTPIVFSPPPTNGIDLGKCLSYAEWNGQPLDACNFPTREITEERSIVYNILEKISKQYNVVRLDKIICDDSVCNTHFNSVFIYGYGEHLSSEGSFFLGKKYNFFQRSNLRI